VKEEETLVDRIVGEMEEAAECGKEYFFPKEVTDDEKKEIQKKFQENSRLNQPITVKFLLKFTVPTILSFVIMGIFGLIDGVFAMRGIDYQAFAAVNIVFPFVMFTMAIGAMLTMGGCALVVKLKGQKKKEEARRIFTMLAIVVFGISAFISFVGWFIREPIVRMLGARGEGIALALEYIEPLILTAPFIMLGIFFVQFVIADGRPTLGMIMSISAAGISTALNATFLFGFNMGLMGLALATGIGYSVSTVVGLVYFSINRKGTLFFSKPKWDIKALGRSALNGVSEAITMMAGVVTIIVLNNTLMHIAEPAINPVYMIPYFPGYGINPTYGIPYFAMGDAYVAIAGIAWAAQNIFASLFFGYVAGVAPITSYNYGKKKKYGKDSAVGAERHANLQKLYRKSLIIVAVLSVLAVALTNIFANLILRVYEITPDDPYVGFMHPLALRGIRIMSIGFILMGFNVFATGWFTAFNDGIVSGIMSALRSFVFMAGLLALMPRAMGLDGAWWAMPIVEALAICVTIFFLWKMGQKYHYLKPKTLKQQPSAESLD